MKKRLAQWFLLVAKRLDPETHIENAQVVEDYEAQKVGLTYVITKKDIKDFRYKDGARMSCVRASVVSSMKCGRISASTSSEASMPTASLNIKSRRKTEASECPENCVYMFPSQRKRNEEEATAAGSSLLS